MLLRWKGPGKRQAYVCDAQACRPHPSPGDFPHRQCWWWWRARPGPGHRWCWWSAWPGPLLPAVLRSGWWCSQQERSLAGVVLFGELQPSAFCWSHSDGQHGTQGYCKWWWRQLQLLLGGCPGRGPSVPHQKAYGCRPGRRQTEKVSAPWESWHLPRFNAMPSPCPKEETGTSLSTQVFSNWPRPTFTPCWCPTNRADGIPALSWQMLSADLKQNSLLSIEKYNAKSLNWRIRRQLNDDLTKDALWMFFEQVKTAFRRSLCHKGITGASGETWTESLN